MEYGFSRNRSLGQILVTLNYITTDQLSELLTTQKHSKDQYGLSFRLGELLTIRNIITESQLEEALDIQKAKKRLLRESMVDFKVRRKTPPFPTNQYQKDEPKEEAVITFWQRLGIR